MRAPAKVNLALVVGPLRTDGRHEVATVLQRITLADRVQVERAQVDGIHVDGFAEDTLVRSALERVSEAAGVPARWRARIAKRIPVAAGLGGGSSDAAAALVAASALVPTPLAAGQLHEIAVTLGADVPFFLTQGPHLATGDGTELAPLPLPLDYHALLALPAGAVKPSTADVYRAFDERNGASGFDTRRQALHVALEQVRGPRDLARLPQNDLASSPLAAELEAAGAFRADVSGAGPAVYALFADRAQAEASAADLRGRATTWVVRPIP